MKLAAPVMPVLPGLPGADAPGVAFLPDPPKPGGVIEKGELGILHAIEKTRTPSGDSWARKMDTDGVFKAWWNMASEYRKDVGFLKGVAGTALLGGTLALDAAVMGAEKLKHNRQRPFEVDPTLHPLFTESSNSYPSGHASTAFAAARIMAHLDPDDASKYFTFASSVAGSRGYAGVHFPSDVVAGAALGDGVARKVLEKLNR